MDIVGDHEAAQATSTDPVCGMSVAIESTRTFEHEGTVYRFCGDRCKQRFSEAPESFLAGTQEVPVAVPVSVAGAQWTCPMDPEIVREEPGPCPICGMALEPMMPSLDDDDDGELAAMTRRLIVAVGLSVPLMVVAMGEMVGLPIGNWLSSQSSGLLQLALATPVVAWCGWPFFTRAWMSLVTRRPNMFTLIALGTGVAWTYSLVALLAPGLFPPSLRGHHGSIDLYFESAAVIIALVLLGQVLELRARKRTGAAVRALLGLTPPNARRIDSDGEERDVPIAEIKVGDRLRVRPGETMPIDGVIEEGAGSIDEAMVTGEPAPVTKRRGDPVTAGTLTGNTSFIVRAEAIGDDTLLAKIVRMVVEAQRTRAPVERVVDVVAAWFVPVVVASAVLAFGVWLTVGPEPRLAHAIVAAVGVLIIACPCALGLATPMSIMVATGRGAGVGVLFRNAQAIQRLRDIDTLVFDKTGTLTEGKPRLVAIHSCQGFEDDEVLQIAASLEAGSEHPLAAAIIAGSSLRSFSLVEAEQFDVHPGLGVSGVIEGRRVLLGNAALLAGEGVVLGALEVDAETQRKGGRTVVFLAVEGVAAGSLVVADPIKSSTREAIASLRADGLRLVMLTGDAQGTAQAVATELGLDEVVAGVLPEGKAELIKRLQGEGSVVAMAGDGINDAPALALADVGIAMGTGTDVAMESADITLVKGDLRGIARARQLSRATMRNIRQNLFFAFFYNAAGIPIAAGILYPVFGVLLSPMIAAAAMSLSSVSVIANALRLRRAVV
ncbi:MAG: Cu+-exporting ATPase [Hyphomicrobiaceae bacterium]|jgi:Cu+-exporting ATPase